MKTLWAAVLALLSQEPENERAAWVALKPMSTAQADFRANDRDGNKVPDFWVADVSGLYRIDTGVPLKLIERSAATADAKPCVPLDKEGKFPGAAGEHASKLIGLEKPSPKAGYWFAAVENYEDGKGAPARYDAGNGRNPSRFGICAYPAEHGKTGRLSFIINEMNTVWKKDTGGKPVDVFPADPGRSGWTRLD